MNGDRPQQPAQPASVDADDAVATYLYLRLGILFLTLLLIAGIAYEALAVSRDRGFCLQPSVSAYYYTPVRGLFVSALIAVGVSLIAIKGRPNTTWFKHEDIALNFAGLMAPIVALVPTVNSGGCWSIDPESPPTVGTGDNAILTPAVREIVENNVWSLLIVAALGLGLALLLRGRLGTWRDVSSKAWWSGIAVVAVVIGGLALWLGLGKDSFFVDAHPVTAGLLGLGLIWAAAASSVNASARQWKRIYAVVALAMLIVAAAWGVVALATHWRHNVFAVEAAEFALFAVYWIAQTKEHWTRAT